MKDQFSKAIQAVLQSRMHYGEGFTMVMTDCREFELNGFYVVTNKDDLYLFLTPNGHGVFTDNFGSPIKDIDELLWTVAFHNWDGNVKALPPYWLNGSSSAAKVNDLADQYWMSLYEREAS